LPASTPNREIDPSADHTPIIASPPITLGFPPITTTCAAPIRRSQEKENACMPRLTIRFVESLKFDSTKGRIQYYRDDQLQGFGLMVRKKSIRYFVEKRVNGKSKRLVIGSFPLSSPEQARHDALVKLADMAKGKERVRSAGCDLSG